MRTKEVRVQSANRARDSPAVDFGIVALVEADVAIILHRTPTQTNVLLLHPLPRRIKDGAVDGSGNP